MITSQHLPRLRGRKKAKERENEILYPPRPYSGEGLGERAKIK